MNKGTDLPAQLLAVCTLFQVLSMSFAALHSGALIE